MKSTADLRRAVERSLLVGALLLYALYIARNAFQIKGELFFSLFDDAMISMRYAQSLAEGHGLLWNPGEAPVEGYTNFLWTLLMAVAHLLGLADSKVSLVVMLLSVACLAANAIVVRRIADRVSGGSAFASVAAIALTLFSYPLIFWSLRGMEVGFLTLLVDVALLASLELGERFSWRSVGSLCAASALAVLTRPDSVGPVFVLSAFAVLISAGLERWKVAIALAASVGITLAAHTAFRYAYYHDTLPNTYYLKVFGTPLSARLLTGVPAFLRSFLLELWPLILLPLALWIRSPARMAARGKQLLFVLLLSQCAYSVYVGGDAWEHLTIANRYISIALPAGFVLIATLVGELLAEGGGRDLRFIGQLIAGAAVISLLAACVYHFAVPVTSGRHVRLKLLVVYVVIDAGIAAGAFYVSRAGLPSSPFRSWALLLVPLWLALDAMGFVSWKRNEASNVDEEMTRLGMAVKEATRPDARIAVTYAGAPPYFSRRPSADLLGKCDRVIAHEPSHLPFLPGHSKWDYPYSIETYHPDLILQTFRLTRVDRALLTESGYVRLANGAYVLRRSPAVDIAAVAAMPFTMHHIWEEP